MPVTPTYPGVYVEELPSSVRTITGVATSVTAFIGSAKQGPTNRAVRVQSFSDFDRQFGGLWTESIMGHMVQQFFLNGGSNALIIRVVASDAIAATVDVGGLRLIAASPGLWMNDYRVTVDNATRPDDEDETLFNLTIERPTADQGFVQAEQFRNLSTKTSASRFVTKVLEEESTLVKVRPEEEPGEGETPTPNVPSDSLTFENPINPNDPENSPRLSRGTFANGSDGQNPPTYADYRDTSGNDELGLQLLNKVDIFNLLCVAPNKPESSVADDDSGREFLTFALGYCEEQRAMLIVDPPTSWNRPSDVERDSTNFRTGFRSKNSVTYYPNIRVSNPLRQNRLESFPPSGVMAGVMARTDSNRGVWKAPAGTEATLTGVREFAYKLSNGENGLLNPLGINCLRNFPVYGNVAWGARTLEGADQLASEWKYIPVRRLALFLEESLYRGTQWVVFEPNDEPLWAQIRLNVGAFMNNLFRQGAFQGKTPREAYFVKCDSETTTQNDIDRGIVNIIIGYAPLKPAEFVILKFQQIAGAIAT